MVDTVVKNEKDTVKTDTNSKKNNRKDETAGWIKDFRSNTLAKIRTFETQLDSITKEKTSLTKELETANVQLTELREIRKNLEDHTSQLKSSLSSVQNEFKYSEEEKTDAFERIQAMDSGITSLKDQNNKLESELKNYKDLLSTSKEVNEELKGKIRLLDDRIEWNEKVHQEDLKKNSELESNMLKVTQLKESLAIDLKTTSERLGKSEIHNRDLNARAKILEEKIASLEMVKKDLSKSRKDQSDSFEKIKDQENQLRSIISLKDALEMDMKTILKDLDNERALVEEYKKIGRASCRERV